MLLRHCLSLYPELIDLALLRDLLVPSPRTEWTWSSHEFIQPKQWMLTNLNPHASEEPLLVSEPESRSFQYFFIWGTCLWGTRSKLLGMPWSHTDVKSVLSPHSGFLLAAQEFIYSVEIPWKPTTRLDTALRFQPYLLLRTPQELCNKPWNKWKTWLKRNSSHLTYSRSSLLPNFCLILKSTTKVKSRGNLSGKLPASPRLCTPSHLQWICGGTLVCFVIRGWIWDSSSHTMENKGMNILLPQRAGFHAQVQPLSDRRWPCYTQWEVTLSCLVMFVPHMIIQDILPR